MITFIPYPDFQETAKCLDYKRLGKQRVEAYQLLRGLLGETKGWIHHPASKMWKGYEFELATYTIDICTEWINRGYKDTIRDRIIHIFADTKITVDVTKFGIEPPWLGNEDVHRSHRANLVRKLPEHYVPLFGNLPPEPYIWPV